jgi:hypothetical protein
MTGEKCTNYSYGIVEALITDVMSKLAISEESEFKPGRGKVIVAVTGFPEEEGLAHPDNETISYYRAMTANYPRIGEGDHFLYVKREYGDEKRRYEFDLVYIPTLDRWFAIANSDYIDAIENDFGEAFECQNIMVAKIEVVNESTRAVIPFHTGEHLEYPSSIT